MTKVLRHLIVFAAAALCVTTAVAPANAAGEARRSLVLPSGSIVPLYPVTGSPPVTAVGFELGAGTLRALDQTGAQLWSVATTGVSLDGGFDFNSDGWPDATVQVTGSYVGNCGSGSSDPIYERALNFFSGATGQVYAPLAPMADACFPALPAGSRVSMQWTSFTPLFGTGTDQLFASPQYATQGWYLGFSGGAFTVPGALYYPSTASYDATYTADQLNAYGTGTSYVTNSHVANGLITPVGGQNRLVFWTTSRVVQYAIGALGAGQLLADRPYLTNGDTTLGGRAYGVVSVDPGDGSRAALIAGTSTYAVWNDLRNGTLGSDGCGGIERHVSLYSLAANTISDVFYAKAPATCASSPASGANYDNYVAFPRNPWIRRGAGQASRLAYNTYTAGRWRLHITEPGSLTDRYALIDVFLWDITDIDGDGLEELIISPTKDPGEPDVPGYYFPKRKTTLQRWNESTLTLTAFKTYIGYVPWLQRTFRERSITNTSRDAGLYPAMYTDGPSGRKLLMMNSSNQPVEITP